MEVNSLPRKIVEASIELVLLPWKLVELHYGTIALWHYGTMARWPHGTLAP